jgi:hypothetical protein
MTYVSVNRCDFDIGQYIGGGKYRVDQVLGEGAFGKVFNKYPQVKQPVEKNVFRCQVQLGYFL